MRGQGVVQGGRLADGLGQVPAVNDDVQGGEAGQGGARHVAERCGVHAGEGIARAGGGQCGGRGFRVRGGRVPAGQVGAGQAARRHRVAGGVVAEQGLAEPQGADDVVEQVPYIPLRARGGRASLVRAYRLDDPGGRSDGTVESFVEFHDALRGDSRFLAPDPSTTTLLRNRIFAKEYSCERSRL